MADFEVFAFDARRGAAGFFIGDSKKA